jgi:hypothetical protein
MATYWSSFHSLHWPSPKFTDDMVATGPSKTLWTCAARGNEQHSSIPALADQWPFVSRAINETNVDLKTRSALHLDFINTALFLQLLHTYTQDILFNNALPKPTHPLRILAPRTRRPDRLPNICVGLTRMGHARRLLRLH